MRVIGMTAPCIELKPGSRVARLLFRMWLEGPKEAVPEDWYPMLVLLDKKRRIMYTIVEAKYQHKIIVSTPFEALDCALPFEGDAFGEISYYLRLSWSLAPQPWWRKCEAAELFPEWREASGAA